MKWLPDEQKEKQVSVGFRGAQDTGGYNETQESQCSPICSGIEQK